MKKRHSIHLLLAAAALLLATAACTKDELADGDRLPEGQYPVEIARITLGVEGGEAQPWGAPQTRVSENAEGTGSTFDAGDRFAVQINGEEGIYIVQDDGSIKAESPLYWSDSGEHTVRAWYPTGDGTIDLSDQSQNLAYLLGGTGTGDYQNPVALTFTHALAKVRVTPTGEVLGKVQSLQLYTYTQCSRTGGTLSTDNATMGWIEMKPCSYNGIPCWEANVVPGFAITKLMANRDNKERPLSQSITPEAGEFYDITLDDPGYTEVSEGEYTVDNEKGLKNLAELVNNGKTDIDITLTGNIDLTGIGWTPIGTAEHPYTGTFDGGIKTISNLTIDQPEGDCLGLFGVVGTGGKVQDIRLENANISGRSNVGGIAGQNEGGTLSNCMVRDGAVSGTGKNVGGVVGQLGGGAAEGCWSSASVDGGTAVGGVAGQNDGSLTACYSWGDVTGTGANVGGVVGQNEGGTLTACYHATGAVTGADESTGGVAGENNGTLTACYWANNQEQGIGENQAGTTGGTEQVTDDNWKDAMDGMNDALISANSEWRYGLYDEGLPELWFIQ